MGVVTERPAISDHHVPSISAPQWKRTLLVCGAASTVLYFGMDLVASWAYGGYSYKDQTISELSALGAPTRSLWVPLGFVYAVLVIAFGVGVWESSSSKLTLRIIAGLVVVAGFVSLVAWPLAPMHQREVLAAGGGNTSDTMHLVLAAVNSLLFVLMITFGATVFGRRFRLYSIATLIVVVVFGGLTALDTPKVEANDPTPWLGIKERLAVLGSMLWMAVLAIALLRIHPSRSTTGENS